MDLKLQAGKTRKLKYKESPFAPFLRRQFAVFAHKANEGALTLDAEFSSDYFRGRTIQLLSVVYHWPEPTSHDTSNAPHSARSIWALVTDGQVHVRACIVLSAWQSSALVNRLGGITRLLGGLFKVHAYQFMLSHVPVSPDIASRYADVDLSPQFCMRIRLMDYLGGAGTPEDIPLRQFIWQDPRTFDYQRQIKRKYRRARQLLPTDSDLEAERNERRQARIKANRPLALVFAAPKKEEDDDFQLHFSQTIEGVSRKRSLPVVPAESARPQKRQRFVSPKLSVADEDDGLETQMPYRPLEETQPAAQLRIQAPPAHDEEVDELAPDTLDRPNPVLKSVSRQALAAKAPVIHSERSTTSVKIEEDELETEAPLPTTREEDPAIALETQVQPRLSSEADARSYLDSTDDEGDAAGPPSPVPQSPARLKLFGELPFFDVTTMRSPSLTFSREASPIPFTAIGPSALPAENQQEATSSTESPAQPTGLLLGHSTEAVQRPALTEAVATAQSPEPADTASCGSAACGELRIETEVIEPPQDTAGDETAGDETVIPCSVEEETPQRVKIKLICRVLFDADLDVHKQFDTKRYDQVRHILSVL